jgi:beta-phosphoglucomutase family hydrolase
MMAGMLKLPGTITACLFDLDGVLTDTARVHKQAWKQMFDSFLHERFGGSSAPERGPFTDEDYERYVDGRPRLDGVRSFLESRGIEYDEDLVRRLGDRKNEIVLRLIDEQGVVVYESSVRFVREAQRQGLHRAVVSSSANTQQVLEKVGIADLFEVRIDGIVAEQQGLAGKPAPDTFLAAARALRVEPVNAAVFEDALAGVEAGRAGHFGLVVGVDRTGEADELRKHGADIVVRDLGELVEDEAQVS